MKANWKLWAVGAALLAGGAMLGGCGMEAPGWMQVNEPQPASPRGVMAQQQSPTGWTARRRRADAAFDHVMEGRYQAALIIYEDLADSLTPGDALGPEVLFWTGYSRQELGDNAGARSSYQRLLRDWDQSSYHERAEKLLAEMERDSG